MLRIARTRLMTQRVFESSTVRSITTLPQTINQIKTENKHILGTQDASPVTINGWIKSVQKLKNVAFLNISDGNCAQGVMAVLQPDQVTSDLTTGACVFVKGNLVSSQGKKQGLELQAESVKVTGTVDEYPIQKKFHKQEFLRTLPALRWRTSVNSSTLRYRSFCMAQMTNFFAENDFVQTNPPLLTSSDCEGAGEVFKVAGGGKGDKFFGDKPAYLTVSTQLHLEVLAAAVGRVWTFTPAFRAENSDTNRHLSEFWMAEAEISFIDDLEPLMDLAEGMVKSCLAPLMEEGNKARNDLLDARRSAEQKEELLDRWDMANCDFPRLTYKQAIKILNLQHLKEPFAHRPDYEVGLRSEHEKWLATEYFISPVFVTDYPKEQKPFYMKQSPHDSQTVACFDLLMPHIGEVIGGSVREDNYDTLLKNIETTGMDKSALEWYLELRKQGSTPHGGFGMGFERLISYATGIENIRDVTAFPRWVDNCSC
jgi:asparaginyl-tRNA synthetase